MNKKRSYMPTSDIMCGRQELEDKIGAYIWEYSNIVGKEN